MDDIFNIQEVIACFANSFDVRDWDGQRSCLTETLHTDYSDLRGTPPQTVTARKYVDSRREALDPLKPHHLVGNYEIDFTDENHASCRASMIVWRKSESQEFTSHCVYEFRLVKRKTGWKISGIKQNILWNECSSSLHKGAQG